MTYANLDYKIGLASQAGIKTLNDKRMRDVDEQASEKKTFNPRERHHDQEGERAKAIQSIKDAIFFSSCFLARIRIFG